MTKVKCTVANCEYWGEGNKCHADEILVEQEIINPEKDVSTFCATFEKRKEG